MVFRLESWLFRKAHLEPSITMLHGMHNPGMGAAVLLQDAVDFHGGRFIDRS